MAAIEKWEGVDLLGEHELLNNMDKYTAAVSEYLGSHYSKGLISLIAHKMDVVSVDTPYDQAGLPDEEIWDNI
jgi:hypothetical protein